MISTRSSRRARLAFVALSLVLVFAALASAAAVGGCLRSEAITTYYSNSAHSSVVGWCISGCQGGCNCTGTSSKFYTIDHIFCTD